MEQGSNVRIESRFSQGDSNITEVYCLKKSLGKQILVYILSILTSCMWLLPMYWSVSWRRKCLYNFVSLEEATHFIIVNWDKELSIAKKINYEKGISEGDSGFGFQNRFQSYYYNERSQVMSCLEFESEQFRMTEDTQLNDIAISMQADIPGEQSEYLKRQNWYGFCEIDVPIPGYLELFVQEILHPFFVFQIYSSALWIYQEYVTFAIIIFCISFISAIINLLMIHSNMVNLREMAYYRQQVWILRKGQPLKKGLSSELVPGDIVFLEESSQIPCDSVLLDGSVLVNESSLTGESVPVLKVKIENNHFYNEKTDKNITMYEGTNVVQITHTSNRGGYVLPQDEFGLPLVLAPVLVIRTSFSTLRGQLIRSILYPKPHKFTFFAESIKFIGILAVFTLIGFFVLLPRFIETLLPLDIFIKFLDLITITVPPSLPASLQVGISFSVARLKAKNIFCISPPKTVVGGRVQTVCFDKTGTLTEDGMDLVGAYIVVSGQIHPTLIAKNRDNDQQVAKTQEFHRLLDIMCSCHSLSRIERNGTVVGDTMELTLFNFAYSELPKYADEDAVFIANRYKEKLDHSPQSKISIQVLKRFDFQSELQRMSILCQINGQTYCLVKGAPEVIAGLATQVPSELIKQNDENAQKGYRLLALAWSEVNQQIESKKSYDRTQFEKNLTISGLVLFDNPVKQNTPKTLKELKAADIHMKIVTGDNALTALAVAQQCQLVTQSQDVYLVDFNYKIKNFEITKQASEESLNNNNASMLNNSLNQSLEDKNLLQQDIEMQQQEQPAIVPINHPTYNNGLAQIAANAADAGATGVISNSASEYPPYVQAFLKDVLIYRERILAFTGPAFDELYVRIDPPQQLVELLTRGQIFARMKPNHKAILVEKLQHCGQVVAMVGDGANDCGALKQADIGLALSDAEASISAPFTSKDLEISSIVTLLIQCRAGLATSFTCFQFMAFYSMVQFSSTILCYYFYAFFSNSFYLSEDLLFIVALFIAMGYTQPATTLAVERPSDQLLSFKCLLSVFGLGAIQLVAQISLLVIHLDTDQLIYKETSDTHKKYYQINQQMNTQTQQGTILFLLTNFIYLTASYVLSVSKPFRKEFYQNNLFLFVFIALWIFSIVIARVPDAFFFRYFEDIENDDKTQYDYLIQSDFTSEILGWAHFWSFIMFLYEKIFINILLQNVLQQKN